MADEKRVSERLKEQTQTRTVFVLTLLGLLFAFFFLPRSVLEYLKDGLTSIGSILGTVSLSGATGAVLGYVISAQDRLATGSSRAAKFFEKLYPRNAIKEKYNCTEGQATYLWFQIFNPWENIGPMKDPYSRTFERSYACRFIFILQWSFFGFFAISSATWIATIICGYWTPLETQATVPTYARVLVLTLTFAAFLMLFLQNRPADAKPTGCWYRWKEINEIHKTWLQNEVFDNAAADTYANAVALVAEANWRKAHGYSA